MSVTIYVNNTIPYKFDVDQNDINFYNCNITTISNNIHKFINLFCFDLQKNYLKNIPSSCFKGVNLELLYLNNNYFKRIPIAIFKLPKLRSIDFANNKIKSLSNIYQNMQTIYLHHRDPLYIDIFKNNILKFPECLKYFSCKHCWISNNKFSKWKQRFYEILIK